MSENIYYHGTHWERSTDENMAEERAFFDLDGGYSDYDVVYVTNHIDTAIYFSKWNVSSDDNIQVILKGEVSAENLLEKDVWELQQSGVIEIDEVEYDLGEREDLFQALRRRHGGFCIKGNYDGKGDDIALFNDNDFRATHAKLLIDGEWSDWLDREEALGTYLRVCGLNAQELKV